MFKFDSYTLTKNIRLIEKALARGDAAKTQADEMIAEIQADKDHSESWKNAEITKVNAALNACFAEAVTPIAALKDYFVSVPDLARAAYNFNDPDLQTAISMIETMKSDLPYQTRTDIIEKFRGNPGALEVIQALYKKYGYPEEKDVKDALEMFGLFIRIEDTFDEFITYATTSGYQKGWEINVNTAWKSANMRRFMNRFKIAFGIDTTIHPLIVAIKGFLEKESDPTIRARVKRFLDTSESDIEKDDPYKVEKGEQFLSEGFKRYLVM